MGSAGGRSPRAGFVTHTQPARSADVPRRTQAPRPRAPPRPAEHPSSSDMSWRRQNGRKWKALALGFACVAIDLSESKCSKGTHYKESKNDCRDCPSGYYQDHQEKKDCKSCDPGKGALDPTVVGRESKCADCQPGRFDNRGGGGGKGTASHALRGNIKARRNKTPAMAAQQGQAMISWGAR